MVGQNLLELGSGEWNNPELQTFMRSALSGAVTPALELNLNRARRPTRNLIVQASRLEEVDLDRVRILVAVTDRTDALSAEAANEEAMRQKDVLLQEVRHRVANSLQIIASVLLQNARKTISEETREHLKDAHHRVMSVAAL